MSLQTQLLGYPWFNKCARSGCFSWLSFISVIFQSYLGASWLPSCTKILLTVRTWSAAIALNYSIKNIRNDVRQIMKNLDSTHVCGARSHSPQLYDYKCDVCICGYIELFNYVLSFILPSHGLSIMFLQHYVRGLKVSFYSDIM